MLCNMRNERDSPHVELDGMTYVEYYNSNRKKDLAYLPPKLNKQDIRISSGVTREKDTSLLSLALSMNFQSDVKAFDNEGQIVNEYGDNLTDLNKKSREIEEFYKKRSTIYRELISQGDVYVQELFVEKFGDVPIEKVVWDPTDDTKNISDFKYKTKIKKILSRCETRMISGKKIYFGNMKKMWLSEQNVVAVLNVYSRDEAYKMYGTWERWNNIPNTIDSVDFSDDGTYKTWNLINLSGESQISEIMLYDVVNNRFQIYLNGIPMLPIKYLLTLISPSGKVPISHGKNEPISDFAYAKSQPAKTKVDEDVLNETTKLMIEGMRLDSKPPLGSRKNKVLSPNVIRAGNISPDMKPGDLFKLLETAGISPASFSFYELMKKAIDDKTVNPSFDGTGRSGNPTATQVTQEKQQQMMKLGLLLDGIIQLETQMTWLRIYNILANWTKKEDVDMGKKQAKIYGKYRSFSMNSIIEDGQTGTKIFRFMVGGNFPSNEEHLKEEKKLTEIYGHEVRIIYLDPEEMRKLKQNFFVSVINTPENNDILTQIVYIQNLRQAYELFGPASINQEYAKQRFSILINEDYNKFFKQMSILDMIKNNQNNQKSKMAQIRLDKWEDYKQQHKENKVNPYRQ